jgi:hypothetical protein
MVAMMRRNLSMRIAILLFIILGTGVLSSTVYGAGKMSKKNMISKEEAISIGKKYLQSKQYEYEIDWDHPHAKLDRMAVKPDGSLTSGLGKRVYVWSVWFLPVEGLDVENTRDIAAVDINAETGEVFIKYSLQKL